MAVAAKLSGGEPVYCETHSEHPDNERFLADCERWFGRPVTRLSSDRYPSTWEVWNQRRYLAGVKGALCSVELKLMPRLAYQRPDDVHVLGYTVDERARAQRMRDAYPEQAIETPLIDRGLDKAACLELIRRAGIELPPLYALGFRNNNCIPCPKAQSPAYWALVRKEFPVEFDCMALLSRELGVKLVKVGDGAGGRKRIFIDEVPLDHPTTDPVQPACDFLCQAAEQDL